MSSHQALSARGFAEKLFDATLNDIEIPMTPSGADALTAWRTRAASDGNVDLLAAIDGVDSPAFCATWQYRFERTRTPPGPQSIEDWLDEDLGDED